MDMKGVLIWLLLLLVICFLALRVLFIPNYVTALSYKGEAISINRDKFGVPRIQAGSRNSAYYAMGYATAEDRIFQMHMKRMVAQGRLSEMFGERSLVVDKIFRTLGLGHWASIADQRFKEEDPVNYAAYQAFSDGVNSFAKNSTLPIDFYLTWTNFHPWTPYDCMCVNSLLNWGQSAGDIGGQYLRSFLASNFTMEEIDIFLPHKEHNILDSDAVIVNDEQLKQAGYYDEYNASNKGRTSIDPQHIDNLLDIGIVDFADTMETSASNSWVISGNLTKSGKPILANDPHLQSTIPSEWYQFEVSYTSPAGKPVHFIGATISGGLTSNIGRTDFVSWGCTNVYTDTIDLYKEKLNEDKTEYLFDGIYRKLQVRKETIKINGKPDLEIEVKHTHRGPIIEYVSFWTHMYNVSEPVSMVWTAFHTRYQFAVEAMNIIEIDNFEEFKEAISTGLNDAPPINFAFITKDGHIGLQVIGSYPIAPYQEDISGYMKDGTTSKYDWTGMLKGKERLQIIDPVKGYIVTANNRLTTKNFHGGRYASNWLITARAIRITEIIKHKIQRGHKFTIEDSKQIQLDTIDIYCRKMVAHLQTLNAQFKELLGDWNCDMTAESSQASIYSMFINRLQKRIKPDDLPVEGHHYFNHYTYRYILNTTTDDVQEMEHIRVALNETLTELETFFMSQEKSSWVWGKLHQDFMEHRPFSRTPFSRIFEKTTAGVGNENTPNVAVMRKLPYGDWRANHRAGIRMVLTYEEGKSEWIIDSGASQAIFSPHYDDQYKVFMNDGYIPVEHSLTSGASSEL